MGKFVAANYVVYAENQEKASETLLREFDRIDDIKQKMAGLLNKDGSAIKNFNSNTLEDELNIEFDDENSLIFNQPNSEKTKGDVKEGIYHNGRFTYKMAYRYPNINGKDADFRLAHEMGHLMLNPSCVEMQSYDKTTDSRKVAGLIRQDNQKNYYGKEIQENAINLLAQFAVKGENSADDIILGKKDVSEYNLYRKADSLVKLLAVSMRNDYSHEISFEELSKGKLDSQIEHLDGTKEPANTFFYGLLNDSSLIEKEFDKYSGKGAWRELDSAITSLHDQNIEPQNFELIFKSAQSLINEFAKKRIQVKYRETIEKDGKNIPNVNNKLAMLEQMVETEKNEKIKEDSKNNENFNINEYGEIIRPQNKENNTEKVEKDSSIQKLSLKQKIAKFLKNNDTLMKIPFLKGFAEKQLNLLPTNSQTINIESNENVHHNIFIDKLSNNGNFKDMPPVYGMANLNKVSQMQRKMEKENEETNR